MSRRRWSSMRRSSRENSKLQNILPAPYMTCTSIRNMRNSGRGPSGVSPMRSLPHSRNWVRFRSLKPLRSWAGSWRRGSRSRSSFVGRSRAPTASFLSSEHCAESWSFSERLPTSPFLANFRIADRTSRENPIAVARVITVRHVRLQTI